MVEINLGAEATLIFVGLFLVLAMVFHNPIGTRLNEILNNRFRIDVGLGIWTPRVRAGVIIAGLVCIIIGLVSLGVFAPTIPIISWLATVTTTQTPTTTPTATSTLPPVPTNTATATATPTTMPTVFTSTPALGGSGPHPELCEQSIIDQLEMAIEAQILYMKGILPAEDLTKTWGNADIIAKAEADRIIFYRDNEIAAVTIIDVSAELISCLVIDEYETGVRALVSERWIYHAALDCSSGVVPNRLKVDTYPGSIYTLVREGKGWKITSYNIDRVYKEVPWRC